MAESAHIQLVHTLATIAWVSLYLLLWCLQGVLSVSRTPMQCRVLQHRVSSRLGMTMLHVVRSRWKQVLMIAVGGSIVMCAFGFATGFLLPALPNSWLGIAESLGLLLFFPAASEELLFRGLLLPRRDELALAAPRRGRTEWEGEQLESQLSRVTGDALSRMTSFSWPSSQEQEQQPGHAGSTTFARRPPWAQQLGALLSFLAYHFDWTSVQVQLARSSSSINCA